MISVRLSSVKETKAHEYLLRFVFGGAATVLAGLVARYFGAGPGGLADAISRRTEEVQASHV